MAANRKWTWSVLKFLLWGMAFIVAIVVMLLVVFVSFPLGP